MASLEVVNGRLHLRMVDGRLTPAEEVRVKRRLDAMQPAFAAAAPPRREPSPTDDAAK
jgi:hypothetical protein